MKYLYVANWKMYMTLNESINFCLHYHEKLKHLSHNATLIICPSFVALVSIVTIVKNNSIAVGAQQCSAYQSGPYTGQISAQTLAESGATYCIVGHSEQRTYCHETTSNIAHSITLLYDCNVQPIICIGEAQQKQKLNDLIDILTEQLTPLIAAIKKHQHVIIAYEPAWSIGTGLTADTTDLKKIFNWLDTLLKKQLPHNTFQLLYGGSVKPENISQLKKIPFLNGFLIGKASTTIESFTNIITQE